VRLQTADCADITRKRHTRFRDGESLTSLETRDHLGRDWLALDLRRIGRILRRPHTGFAAFDRNLARDQYLMRHIEARSPEFADLRRQLDGIAESDRPQKPCARIDQRQADNAEGRGEIGRFHAQRRFEQCPRAPIEKFEESAVEDETGRIALSPLDGEMPPVDEMRHGKFAMETMGRTFGARSSATVPGLSNAACQMQRKAGAKTHDGRACARPSRPW